MGYYDCIIEGDSTVVIGWGQGKEYQLWRMWNLVYEIRELAMELRCSFSHIPREQNSLAYELANWGVGQASLYISFGTPF